MGRRQLHLSSASSNNMLLLLLLGQHNARLFSLWRLTSVGPPSASDCCFGAHAYQRPTPSSLARAARESTSWLHDACCMVGLSAERGVAMNGPGLDCAAPGVVLVVAAG